MKLSEVLLLRSRGFTTIDPDLQADIMEQGLKRIRPETDFIVFDPKANKERVEDEGRTLVLRSKAEEKVYAKLENFGTPEALSENCGYAVNTKYSVIFMLAQEY